MFKWKNILNPYKKILNLILVFAILIFAASASAEKRFEISTVPLNRNGYNLYLSKLQVAGSSPEKNILLIHGLTYSSHVFDVDFGDYSFARFLAKKGYAVWLLDLTGYGRSDELSDGFLINSEYAAEDINAGKIDLLGWSMGTISTAKFAAQYPEKVRKLILYTPIFNGIGAENLIAPFHQNTWEHAAEDFQKITNGEINFKVVEAAVVTTLISDCWKYDKDSSPNS